MKGLMKYARWLWVHSKGVRMSLFGNVLLGILNVALTLGFIYICKRIVDIATGVLDANIVHYTIAVLIVIVLRLTVSAVNVKIENLASSRMNFIIRRNLYSSILQSQWQGREKFHTGDTLNRLETDVSKVTDVIVSDFPQVVTTLVQLVAAVGFLCFMDWRLALVLVLFTPVMLILSRLFFRKIRGMTRDIRDLESKVQSHLQESLQHRMVIQSMENEDRMEDRLDSLQEEEYGRVVERTRFNLWARTIVSASFSFGYILAFLRGAYGILKGSTSFGTMTAFLQLVGQIQRPVVNLTRQIPAFIYATASIDRLMELEEAPREESGEAVEIAGPSGVRISGLSFRYPDGDEFIFNDFSCDFPPGSSTAILGETGIGKSTLIKLILSLLRPVKGSVEVYNADTAVNSSPLTRCNFVYVPQGNTLFSGTIRENLLMGDPEASSERLEWALRSAVADFVMDLPDGMDSVCGEGGTGLSEGQAQRIAIARGLLRPGKILLLDEFSSSLDPSTELRLMENIMALSGDKTIIFITHREAVAAHCSRIVRIA